MAADALVALVLVVLLQPLLLLQPAVFTFGV